MKLKSIGSLILALLISFVSLSAFASAGENDADKAYLMGRLSRYDTEQEAAWAVYGNLENAMTDEEKEEYWALDTNTLRYKGSSVVYDNITLLLFGLQSGKVDIAYLPEFLADYVAAHNENMHSLSIPEAEAYAQEHGLISCVGAGGVNGLTYRMAMLPDRSDLQAMFNDAL